MLDRFPDYIDPLIFAERNSTLSGAIKINELTRLSDLLLDNAGEIAVDVSFSKEGRVPVIAGSAHGELVLECQSCLKKLIWPIDVQFKLGVVTSLAQADRLPEELAPLLLEGDKVSVMELIEDEILLALPDFPRHAEACVDYLVEQALKPHQTIQDKTTQKHNPFSVLAQLKNNTGDK